MAETTEEENVPDTLLSRQSEIGHSTWYPSRLEGSMGMPRERAAGYPPGSVTGHYKLIMNATQSCAVKIATARRSHTEQTPCEIMVWAGRAAER